jgi:MscS family membrane protein
MSQLSTWLSEHIGLELWMASLVAIALVTVVVNQIAQVLLRHAARVTERTASVWDDALVQTASRPVLAATWIIGLGFMTRVLQAEVEAQFVAEALAVRDVLLVICVAWFLIRFAGRVGQNITVERVKRGDEVDRTTVDALVKLSRLVVFIVALLIVAQTLGFQITGLLALGGVGGIAVGFAAKDLLANFFGGLTIYLDRPFSVGEWIRSPDKSLEGTVEYISWRHTRIRAFNRNPIYVPNAVFTTIVVENPSRMSHRRIRETVGVRYDDFEQVEAIVADIKAMLIEHPEIDSDTTLIVNFNGFGASSLDILIYCFTHTTVWVTFHGIKQDVLLRIGRIIAAHGAEIAFPTQTLHIASNAPVEPGRGDDDGAGDDMADPPRARPAPAPARAAPAVPAAPAAPTRS